MAGFLAYLAAGATKGAGDGIVAEAKAKREAAISALENDRLMAREDRSRAFQAEQGSLDRASRASEAATEREYRSGESAADRAFRLSEGEKDRAAQTTAREETMTNENGETIVRSGDRVRPVLDQNGKPVKALRADSSEPAEVKMANWLVTKGIAKDPAEAYKLVTRAKGSDVTPVEIEKMVETATKNEIGDGMGITPEKIAIIRERNRKRITEGLGVSDTPTESAPATVPRPDKADDAQLVQDAKAALKAGVPAEAVRTRLKSWGIDPAQAGL